ncbi:MAG TPA: hypothetical protein VIK89_03545 [Cytophagaceae bacterium]
MKGFTCSYREAGLVGLRRVGGMKKATRLTLWPGYNIESEFT